MVIIAQDEKSIYDLEKFSSATAKEDGTVYLLNYSGELAFPVGKYETEERASEIVGEIFALFDTQRRYVMPVI